MRAYSQYIGAIGDAESNPLDDVMVQREEAIRDARLNLLKRAYKDAGLDPHMVNFTSPRIQPVAFYKDPATGILFCKVVLDKETYRNLVKNLSRGRK